MTQTTTVTPPRRTRQVLTKAVDNLFGASLMLSFILGILLVLIQLAGLIVGAGGLVEATSQILGPVAFAAAAAAGVLSLAAMYLHRWTVVE